MAVRCWHWAPVAGFLADVFGGREDAVLAWLRIGSRAPRASPI
jgi:hypothetical protein